MKLTKCILFALSIFILTESHCQYNWEEVNVPDSIEVKMIAFDSTGNQFIASNHGVYFSENGYDWEQTSHTDYESYIYINENHTIYTGMIYLYRSFDMGITWDSIFYSPEGGIMSICSLGDSIILVGNWGGIYRSNDSGQTWDRVLETYSSEVFRAIENDHEGILYAGSISYFPNNPGGIYRSDDNGATWILYCLEYHFVSSIIINYEDEIFVGTRGHGYLGGGRVLKSIDDGQSWVLKYDNNLIESMAINALGNIALGCDAQDGEPGGVIISFDDGESWEDITSDLPTRTFDQVKFDIDDHLYAITHFEGQLFKTDQPVGIKESSNSSYLYQVIVYPNPAHSFITIFPITENINKLRITDIYGHQICELINANKTGLITLNIENLVPGLYFIEGSGGHSRSHPYKFLKY